MRRLIRYGEWGVDIFFVLSGFLLTIPWIKNGIKTPTWSETIRFYQRRALRILPALYFTLLILIYILQYGLDPLPTPTQMLQHALFINVWFGSKPLRGAFWSLPVEAYFYLFLLLFLIAAVRLRSFVGLMTLVIIVAIAVRTIAFYSPLIHNKAAYLWSFFGRADQFAIGALFAYKFVKQPLNARLGSIAIVTSVFGLIAMASFMGRPGDTLNNGPTIFLIYQTFVGAIAGLLVYGAASKSKLSKFIFGNVIMTFIGTISYSVYLSHTIVLDIFVKIHPVHSIPESNRLGIITAYTWPPIFIAATLSYFLVERYFLKLRHAPGQVSHSFVQKYPMRFLALTVIALVALTWLARVTQMIGAT